MSKGYNCISAFNQWSRRNKIIAVVVILATISGGLAAFLGNVVNIKDHIVTILEWFVNTEEPEDNPIPSIKENHQQDSPQEKHIVVLWSQPEGAKIFINDQETEWVTDVKIELTAGLYSFRFEKDGYIPQTISANVPRQFPVIAKLEEK